MRSLNSVMLSIFVCATTSAVADDYVTAGVVSSPSAAPAKTAVETRAEADALQAKELRAAGYKPETQNGETLWCRKEAQTGSTFQKKTCASAQALAASVKESQDFAIRIQRQSVTTMKGN